VVTIGFVGLGVMGGTIARRLLRAGYVVQGYNRTPSKATALQGSGLTPQPTPRDAAHGAAVVFSMVSDGDALVQVCQGEDGILAGLGPEAI
jgi:3-hydroxyisobutyrate dehydrogenase-like beta-hydroxyacid dehydrogenase